MNQYKQLIEDNALNVPHISTELAEHLTDAFSADKQIQEGLLSDANVVRSEPYLLGFLAGLGYAQNVISVMIQNQDGQFAEIEDVTESFIQNQ